MAKKLAFDRWLFGTVALLIATGLVMVYSASQPLALATASEEGASWAMNPFVAKQAIAALVGLGVMLILMHLDYRLLGRPAVVYASLGGVLVLLVAVLFAPELNNTHRWFVFGPISVQPSEIAKLSLIPFAAYQIAKKPERIGHQDLLAPVLGATLVVVCLVFLQPDFGTCVLLFAAVALMLFLAGLPWRYLALAALAAVPLAAVAIFSADYRRRRVLAFLDPEADHLGAGYQASQSLIAVGSGGLTGLGPGGSVQKLHFLPHPHSDYIFAIVCEELGLLGALGLLLLFTVVLWRGIRAGANAPDLFGRYLAFGLTGLLGIQALLHVSVSLSLLPTKGIPLPFISYGGSSLVASMAACGILLNISEHG